VRQETEEIVLAKYSFERVSGAVEVPSESDFEGVAVVDVDEDEEDGDCSEETADVGQYFVDLLERAFVRADDSGLEE